MLDISIIIPHKSTPHNDQALLLNMNMLLMNTRNRYELIIDAEAPKDPYTVWNEAAKQARGEILVFSNSDILLAHDWDVMMLKHIQDNAILAGYLVEPGAIGVASENIHRDFGRTPDTFKLKDFQDFCTKHSSTKPEVKEERGWYMPCAILKSFFLKTGGFNTDIPFPNPNDIDFWERCITDYGTKLLRVNSYAYHFQNLSGRL